jgi:hypothetical protein
MGDHKDKRAIGGAMVTATEIACWVYCPEHWQLQYGEGRSPKNWNMVEPKTRQPAARSVLATGTRYQ